MAPRVDKVVPSQWTNDGADVVIIGGGIIGCSTALFLAERGISTVLLEKSEIACEQSSRNWGWCRTQGRDIRELPLILESMRLWRSLGALTGNAAGFATCGTLKVLTGDRAIENGHRWLQQARDYGVDSRVLGAAEIAQLLPGNKGRWKEALYAPSDGRAEPSSATSAIATAAIRAGARIHTRMSACSIELSRGEVSGVVLDGGRIACHQVVLAGGAWSSAMLRPLGVRLPQLTTTTSTMRTQPIEDGPSCCIQGGGFSIRKRSDGGYTIGWGNTVTSEVTTDSFRYFTDFTGMLKEEWPTIRLKFGARTVKSFTSPHKFHKPSADTVLDPAPIGRELSAAWSNLVSAFPIFDGVQIAERWAGLIDVLPDAVPVISKVDNVPGLIVSTGYSGHGFGLGLGAGRLTADLAANDNPVVDPAPFRLSRF